MVEDPHFGSDLLDATGAHEEEPILRMGPIATPLHR
jgi:L-2,4-diaminobutyric acid acetyltransferase